MTALQSQIYKDVAARVIPKIDPGDFWSWMQRSKPGQCKLIGRSQDEDKIADVIKSLDDNFYEQTKTQRQAMAKSDDSAKGKSKGKGKTSVKPAADGKAAGKGKGKSKSKGIVLDPERLDDLYMPFLNALKNEDGTTAKHVRAEDDNAHAAGVGFGMPGTQMESILQMGGTITPYPKAYVMYGLMADMHTADTNDIMMTTYQATQIQFPIAVKRGDPIETFDAVLINVGATMIHYKEAIAMVTQPAVAYTPMSIRIHKSQVDPKVYSNLKNGKNFTNYIEQVICKEWLVPEAMAKTAMLGTKAITINGEIDEIQYGFFFVFNDKAHAALKRSGQKGTTIGYKAYDETTHLINLPKKTTMKQALEMSKLVGELSMGIVYKSIFNGGNSVWTLRVLKDDANEKKARSLLDPELAATVGEIMTAPLSQGRLYEVRNLDSAWDLKQVVKTIAETGWSIRPEKFIKTTSRSSNNVLVFALTPPRQYDIKVNGSTRWLSIINHEPPKPKKNAWDIVFTKHNAEMKGQQGEDEPPYWPGQTENEYRNMYSAPAWMKARECDEMHNSDNEENAAEN
jgi:hypothetical protein